MNRRLAAGALTGAFIGGTVGALLTWFALGRLRMTPGDWVQTLGLIAVLVGWLVAHEMTLSAQRAQVRDQVLNEARLAVLGALEQQRRAVNFATSAMGVYVLESAKQPPGDLPASAWLDVANDLRTGGMSVEVLRSYEQAFPRTRFVREELSNWQNGLYGDLYAFCRGDAPRSPERAKDLFGRNGQLLGYLDELRVHVQNDALAEIMGHTTARVPRVGYTGILRSDPDGNLHLPN